MSESSISIIKLVCDKCGNVEEHDTSTPFGDWLTVCIQSWMGAGRHGGGSKNLYHNGNFCPACVDKYGRQSLAAEVSLRELRT